MSKTSTSNILSIIEAKIPLNDVVICIGMDNNKAQNQKIQNISEEFLKKYNATIVFVGNLDSIDENLKNEIEKNPDKNKYMIINNDLGSILLKENCISNQYSYTETSIQKVRQITQTDIFLNLLYIILNKINEISSNNNKSIFRILCNCPEKIIFGLVFYNQLLKKCLNPGSSLKEEMFLPELGRKKIAGIRGSLSSSAFLKFLLNLSLFIRTDIYESMKISRIALMETFNQHQFFFAPVGIDEAANFERKKSLILQSGELMEMLAIKPNIVVLSGGRNSDLGRDKDVDKTIKEAELLVDFFKKEGPKNYLVSYGQILIEKAVENKANFILAPDGISGNLIYRTLVHLGQGKAYGALYANIFLKYRIVLVDCSRDGEESEIYGSLIQAAGFLGL
jgi:predicted methyltransferase MtxX (methanogen marker protein 4)